MCVRVDVKEFSRFEAHLDVPEVVEASHAAVSCLRIEPKEGLKLRVESGNQIEDLAHIGEIHVGPWFVGFGFDGKSGGTPAILLHRISSHGIEAVDHSAKALLAAFGEDEVESFPSVPKDHHFGSELHGGIDGAAGVFQSTLADFWIVAGHGTVLENGLGKKGRRVHSAFQAVIPHDSLGGRDLVEGEFHVMELHVGDAGFGQEREPLEDGEIRARGTSKGIATGAKIPNASTQCIETNFAGNE